MLKSFLFGILCLAVFSCAAYGQETTGGGRKILVAYFSKTNNTRTIAEIVQSRLGSEAFHVTTQKPYPEDYRETTRVARIELDNNERPALAASPTIEEMQQFDVIFLGYPNWWGTIPMALFTFLEQYDLTGKTIVPFCTHEGSGLGRGPSDIAKLCPGSTHLQGLAVRGSSVSRAQGDVDAWLRQLGFLK